MTRPLLLLALALGFLLWLRGRGQDKLVIVRWLEDGDGIAPPDPWTTGLLADQRLRVHVATRRWPSAFCPGCKAAEAAGIR